MATTAVTIPKTHGGIIIGVIHKLIDTNLDHREIFGSFSFIAATDAYIATRVLFCDIACPIDVFLATDLQETSTALGVGCDYGH